MKPALSRENRRAEASETVTVIRNTNKAMLCCASVKSPKRPNVKVIARKKDVDLRYAILDIIARVGNLAIRSEETKATV